MATLDLFNRWLVMDKKCHDLRKSKDDIEAELNAAEEEKNPVEQEFGESLFPKGKTGKTRHFLIGGKIVAVTDWSSGERTVALVEPETVH
jgi:hypothetical protein